MRVAKPPAVPIAEPPVVPIVEPPVARNAEAPAMSIAEAPAVRIVCAAIEVGAPMVAGDVKPPLDGVLCTREVVDAVVPTLRIAAIPTVGCIDGELVDTPIVGVVDALIVLVVPIVVVLLVGDDVVSVVGEPVVEADPPVVPKEVSAGSVTAAGPTPNLAAKELKSVAAPKPKVASKASKSGSDVVGMMGVAMVGNVNVVVVGAVDVVVTMPPVEVGEVGDPKVEFCACATHGVAMSTTGAIHPMILFISPPWPTKLLRFAKTSTMAAHGGFRVAREGRPSRARGSVGSNAFGESVDRTVALTCSVVRSADTAREPYVSW